MPGASHERKQHTAGGARRTSGARHRAQGVRITRRSLDHRGGRLRLLSDRPRTRGVRHRNDRQSGELVPGHERLGHRSDPQVIRASYSLHSGSGHHGHPGVRGGNRPGGARDRPPSEVSADRQSDAPRTSASIRGRCCQRTRVCLRRAPSFPCDAQCLPTTHPRRRERFAWAETRS